MELSADPMTARQSPRDRLLKAARAVLDRDGLEGLTLRAIAREAGVSHGAPLRHFDDLAALLTALAAEGFRELKAEVTRSVEADEVARGSAGTNPGAISGTDPRAAAEARLLSAGAGYLRFATRNAGVFGLMFRPEMLHTSDGDYQTAGAESFDQLLQLVRTAQDVGWHPDQPTDQLAAMLWANVHGIAQLWLHGALQAVVAVDSIEDLVTVFMRVGLD